MEKVGNKKNEIHIKNQVQIYFEITQIYLKPKNKIQKNIYKTCYLNSFYFSIYPHPSPSYTQKLLCFIFISISPKTQKIMNLILSFVFKYRRNNKSKIERINNNKNKKTDGIVPPFLPILNLYKWKIDGDQSGAIVCPIPNDFYFILFSMKDT